jgi:hypothetical protein
MSGWVVHSQMRFPPPDSSVVHTVALPSDWRRSLARRHAAKNYNSLRHVCLSVRPFAGYSAPTGRILLQFYIGDFYQKFVENIQVWLESAKGNTWRTISINIDIFNGDRLYFLLVTSRELTNKQLTIKTPETVFITCGTSRGQRKSWRPKQKAHTW